MCDLKLQTSVLMTPIGDLNVCICVNGLHGLSPTRKNFEPNINLEVEIKQKELDLKNKYIEQTIEWLNDFFNGQQKGVSVPAFCPNLGKTKFYRKVWSTLVETTTFGQTVSYSDLAVSAGHSNASRAVGTAVKNNPILLMIPCHRVIKKNGTVGNFSAGISLKEWLISFEQQFKH